MCLCVLILLKSLLLEVHCLQKYGGASRPSCNPSCLSLKSSFNGEHLHKRERERERDRERERERDVALTFSLCVRQCFLIYLFALYL